MHVLFIPSFYPEKDSRLKGVFFRNQFKMLASKIDKVGVVYVEQKSLKKIFSNFTGSLYQTTFEYDGQVLSYRMHGISLLNQYSVGASIWIYLTGKLIDKYIIENGKPDVLHAQNVFHGGRVALACSKKHNIPFFVTEHSSGFLLNEYSVKDIRIAKDVFAASAHNIAVSYNLGAEISKCSGNQDIKIIPNAIDTKRFKLGKVDKEIVPFAFVAVGNLLKNKGHHILIRAFKLFCQENASCRLEIYGEGPELANLKQLIIELKLTDKVYLKGKKSPEELIKCYQSSHCLVLPSFKETFGVVIIEAMSCGLPVIATRSGGPEDIVNDFTGILIPPGDIESLHDAMVKIYKDFLNYDSNRIREFVKTNYSEEVVTEKLLELYDSAVVANPNLHSDRKI